jgi:protein-disulfide isomerase
MEKSTKITIIVSILIIAFFTALIVFIKKPEEKVTFPLKVEIFSSFVCIHCKDFYPTVYKLKQEYQDNQNVEFIYYHTNSTGTEYNAFLAELAAGEQGKDWEYMQKLYENQGKFDETDLIKYAEELSLDIDKFNTDRNSTDIQAKAQTQFDMVNKRNISSTPTIYINDRIIKGDRDENRLRDIINQKLELGKKQLEVTK